MKTEDASSPVPALSRVAGAVAVLAGCFAFALVLVITDPPGPGLDPDALSYLGAAESLAAHGTYREPMARWTSADSTEPLAHFPPGFPTALAVPIKLGMAPPQAARLVEAVSAFVTVTILVALVSAAASPVAGGLLALALFAMTSMHEVHASVLSEPLYLACMALVLAAMVRVPSRPLAAGIPAAIGAMTRYAGVSLVAAAMLWSFGRAGTLVERARRALVAALPAAVLEVAWVVRTRLVAGPHEIRRFAAYGGLGATLRQGSATLAAWLVPDAGAASQPLPHRGGLAVAVACVLSALVALGMRRGGDTERAARGAQRVRACAVLLGAYACVVIASRLLADPQIPFDERILAPALVLLMTMAAVGLAQWWGDVRFRLARVAVAGALGAWWIAAATATAGEARYALRWGSDFAGSQWRTSELLDWARHHPAPLYTNWPAAVYFHLHRPARALPVRTADARMLALFGDTVRARHGRVLLFDVTDALYVAPDSVRRASGLRLVATLSDGVVLGP